MWFEHEPEPVIENVNYKILWDLHIKSDHITERRPDMIMQEKINNSIKSDFAIPYDCKVDTKETEEIMKYHRLSRRDEVIVEYQDYDYCHSAYSSQNRT